RLAVLAVRDHRPVARRPRRTGGEDVQAPSPAAFLPYLSGERTPHNAPEATAALLGLRRDHDLPVLVQAVMEGVAFAFADCCAALSGAGTLPEEVWVAGGGSQSRAWLKIIASATGLTLKLPANGPQGAALGAARLAATASGMPIGEVMTLPDMADRILPDVALGDLYTDKLAAYRQAWSG
ncbi:MAG: FGGY-family carbohydrate kinase, partial [Pseudomonadota bacterium]